MVSNFSFLTNNQHFSDFTEACIDAEKSIAVSPATTAILSRRALELAVKWLYANDSYLNLPYQDNLSTLIHEPSFKDILEPDLFPLIKYIVKLGNISAHTNSKVTKKEAIISLHNLHQFTAWIDYCYSPVYSAPDFDENILPAGEDQKLTQAELEKLSQKLGASDRKLKDVISSNEQLREELRKVREEKAREYDFSVDEISEYETRKRYIDVDLKDAGWLFGENCLEEYELQGMPFGSGTGYADYVLIGDNGKPLAVIEAKRTSRDPEEGKQQALLYANCLEAQSSQRPIIFYTNGFDTYIWDDSFYSARRVYGFYAKDDLQLLIDRRCDRLPLDNIKISDDITDRYYQKEAIKAVCETFSGAGRKVLLVMATGSGKTRTVISLIDILTRHQWVKNVLFLADRTALVRQAKNSTNNLLPNLSLCNLLDSRENPESRMVLSTYPTMMNAIDETKLKDGKKLFTVGHFDLIIIDEAHRSIFKKYQAIFNYFDSLLVGLTATPKDDLDKNTYDIFGLETHMPTYAYELEQAVIDGYLVPYNTVETGVKFMEEGIHYDQLSEEEKEQYEDTFENEEIMPDFISSDKLNTWLFNADTIDKVLAILMEKGLKVEGGDKLGKTIIFAKNHNHAVKIVERFDAQYPQYSGHFARVIDTKVNYAQDLIDSFSDKDKSPQIAVSVDMLDTGIDIPEILNLVFFKKVRSKAKFWQMIGRGTRLCKDLLGPGINKDSFLIFDFCGNFEFFRISPKGKEVKGTLSLTEKLFNVKLDLIKELQHLDYQQEEFISFRERLINEWIKEIKGLNKSNFIVKQSLKHIDKYLQKNNWTFLGVIDVEYIKEFITPLIIPNSEDEMAKRFDYLLFTMELALVMGRDISKGKKEVIKAADALSNLGTIPQVNAQKEFIEKIRTDKFWNEASFFDLEKVRDALRELIKFIEKESRKIYYTNFTDEILYITENQGDYGTGDFHDYKKKLNQYIRENQNHVSVHKLKINKPLTKHDILALEDILWNKIGTREDYEKEFGDTPLTVLIRNIVGLDIFAANEAFSEFLNDQSLDSKQSRFVKTIVDYVVKNGVMEKSALQEEPFQSIGSITDLFSTDRAMKIVGIIDSINKNAVEVTGA